MNKPTDHFDEREWRLQERALREERLHAEEAADPDIAAYRRIVRALREAPEDALPQDFAVQVAAQAARLPARADYGLERWLVRLLSVAFVVSALYFVAIDGGDWLRASLSLLPAEDATALRSWGLALGGCIAMTWAFGRLRIDDGHARG